MAICPVPPHKFMFLYQHFRNSNNWRRSWTNS